jgi:hypothetical protein
MLLLMGWGCWTVGPEFQANLNYMVRLKHQEKTQNKRNRDYVYQKYFPNKVNIRRLCR